MYQDPEVPPYSTSDKTSFAYISAKDRWPVILTGAIDDVHRSLAVTKDGEAEREGKTIIEGLAKLKHELQHDKQILALVNDGCPDVEGYNKELEHLASPTWFNVPWLFAECYLYRRISSFFVATKHWKNYDIFSRQKLSTFKSSRPAVIELASRYKTLMTQLSSTKDTTPSPETEQQIFTEMCEICLWGNATDLSLLTNLSYADIQKLQGSNARKAQEANILVNDLPAAFKRLKTAQAQNPNADRRIDVILDNAGFELFVDLILAGYLIASGLATHIVLHPKSIPWFVSDVIPADFSALLSALADPAAFYSSQSDANTNTSADDPQNAPLKDEEVEDIRALFEHWSDLHAEGQLVIRPNRFWTQAGSYWRMPSVAPSLYSDLQRSELVIFKGDLNYRKLTGDVAWSATTPFAEAIGPLAGKDGLSVLALRTCKADVVVGLKDGEDERIRAIEGGGGDSGARKWAWSGKWAVVQFCDRRGT